MNYEDAAKAGKLTELYRKLKEKSDPGFFDMLGPDIKSFDAAKRELVMTFEAKDWMNNPMMGMHGGIIAALADSAMGVLAIMLHEGKISTTVDLNISFLRPVPLGKTITVKAGCQKLGRSLTFMTCEGFIEDESDRLLFTAACRYMLL